MRWKSWTCGRFLKLHFFGPYFGRRVSLIHSPCLILIPLFAFYTGRTPSGGFARRGGGGRPGKRCQSGRFFFSLVSRGAVRRFSFGVHGIFQVEGRGEMGRWNSGQPFFHVAGSGYIEAVAKRQKSPVFLTIT